MASEPATSRVCSRLLRTSRPSATTYECVFTWHLIMIIKIIAPVGVVLSSLLSYYYYKKSKQLLRQLQIVS